MTYLPGCFIEMKLQEGCESGDEQSQVPSLVGR